MEKTDAHIIKERIRCVREWLKNNGFSACIIPQADPHQSEYVENHYKARAYFSGFDGSAGTLVVSTASAALWTDSRYFIQASIQLSGTGIELCKQGMIGTPSISEWIKRHTNDCKTAANAAYFSHKQWSELKADIDICDMPGFEDLWENRPPESDSKTYIHDIQYCGEQSLNKLKRIREQMAKDGIDLLIVPDLDDVAWISNLRASDVEYNPVLRSYITIDKCHCCLFINNNKIPTNVLEYLKGQGIEVADYDKINADLSEIKGIVGCDFSKLCEKVYSSISPKAEIKDVPLFVSRFRAIKNATEIAGYRNAMEKDGIVWVKFLKWFENNKTNNIKFTETDISDKLKELKSKQDLFIDESFGTIAGYGAHGAIGHYSASSDSNSEIEKHGFLVIDSGTHYLDGTTDITRTLNCGVPEQLSEEERKDYTLVLKGHIALAKAVFPEGTKGCQLDILARQFLWENLENYGHGTGHGVGHLLNVHEGYAWLRPRDNGEGYRSGLTMTDEPGIYREGKHGVRIENTILVTEAGESTFGKFLKFETLTICPYDLSPIIKDMITESEKEWILNYHRMVYQRLQSKLNDEDRAWLSDYIEKQNKYIVK